MKVNKKVIRSITSVCAVVIVLAMFGGVFSITAHAETYKDLYLVMTYHFLYGNEYEVMHTAEAEGANNTGLSSWPPFVYLPMDYAMDLYFDLEVTQLDGSLLVKEGEKFTVSARNIYLGVDLDGDNDAYACGWTEAPDHFVFVMVHSDGTFSYSEDVEWGLSYEYETHSYRFTGIADKDISKVIFRLRSSQYKQTGYHGYANARPLLGGSEELEAIEVTVQSEEAALLEGIGDKLEDQNQKLDELPDKIGDEFQGVIDQEKDQATGEGNKFVDQVLDKLPDPSQGILSALGDLTSSINYTGTAATLAIPAIVLPSIDGLFPETEIWSGTEFSFSEYVEMMPSGLLTLVKSLFTIAIVLFCVYELKGIISYCLTLREKDGG